jgi:ribonuclease E
MSGWGTAGSRLHKRLSLDGARPEVAVTVPVAGPVGPRPVVTESVVAESVVAEPVIAEPVVAAPVVAE